MNILLKFDYEDHLIRVPDGYIFDVKMVQLDFFEWLYRREKNMTALPTGRLGCAYSAADFLHYINEVILRDSNERAFFIRSGRIDKRLSF